MKPIKRIFQRKLPRSPIGLYNLEPLEPRLLMSADPMGSAVAADPIGLLNGHDDKLLQDDQAIAQQLLLAITNGMQSNDSADTPSPEAINLASLGQLFNEGGLAGELSDENVAPSLDDLAAMLTSAEGELREEVIFIDTSVDDYQTLLAGIATNDPQTHYTVIEWQPGDDALAAISNSLRDLGDVDAIHIISHGNETGFALGDEWLSEDSLNELSPGLAQWRDFLDSEADLLIYGCDLAAGEAGRELLNSLANITGADVAASDDLTGATALGGDWQLEYQTGTIDTAIAFNDSSQQAFATVLDSPTGGVSITGTAVEDNTLTADTSTLADADGLGTFSYQWLRDAVAISGATGDSYTLVDADVGSSISVTVSYVDGSSTAESVTSAGTAAVINVNDSPTGSVTIDGSVVEDQTLTANTSTLADEDGLGAYAYQWRLNGVAIAGATSATYTLGDSDVNGLISVQVSYTDGFGNAEAVSSANTAAVQNVNDATSGDVIVTGTATEDQTLTADASGLGDDDGLGTFSYQWQRDGSNISGASNSTYTLGDDDVGTSVRVVVSYTDGNNTVESVASAGTAAVQNINDAPSGSVVIEGLASEDQTLTANTNALVDNDGLGTLSYQWQRDGGAIAGATSSTYTLGDDDVGTAITVVVSYTDGGGASEAVTSAATAAVTNINDAPTGGVSITGTVTEDQTLTADTSALADVDGLGAFSYQWLRNGAVIGGATASTYTLDDADVGKAIRVVVTYTDGGGKDETVISAATAAVQNINDAPAGSVVISGAATEDQTLTADTSGLSDNDGLGGGFSYQWQRNGVDISGATNSSYNLGDADVGAAIRVVVSYTDGQGQAESSTSVATAAVTSVNDAPTGGVTVDGNSTQGSTLTANTSSLADADGLGTFSYQWQRNGVDILFANSSTYTVGLLDVGSTLSVEVSYLDGQGTNETVSSSDTPTVPLFNSPPSGTVVITGTATEDQVLTADTSGISDPNGLGTFNYQWRRDGVNITGATASTYTLGDADVDATIRVVVSYTDGGGTGESLSSAATAAVANINDAPTGGVSITGTATENQTLIANTAALVDDDGLGSLSYQWLRGGSVIAGATNSTYTLADADVGENISLRVSYTDSHGSAEQVTSSATAAVSDVNDAPQGAVVITGIAAEDQTLGLDTSGISDDDGLGSFSYQWLRDGVAISGATGSSYTLVDADVGATITAQLSYTDGHGNAESLTSAGTAAISNVNDLPTGSVTIDGTVAEDQTLSANTSALADNDGLGVFSYQWRLNGVDIAGANGSTYTLGDSDVGGLVSVQVTYTDGEGSVETLNSANTAAVQNINDAVTGAVSITGTVTEDQTLTADTSGLADNDGLGAFSYQWQRDGSNISGSTNASYTLGDSDVGKAITVVVSYTDGQGTVESIASAATAAVANVNDAPTGGVTIDGLAAEQQTLSANISGLADADGLGTLNYQWQRDGVNIAGATGSSYTLDDIDVGAAITVAVSYSDGGGTSESVTSAATNPITNVNDSPTGGVIITGTVTEDQTLSADTSALADDDGLGALSYQWQRDGVAISGATASTYTLGDADVGTAIRVVVSYTDVGGKDETVISAATAAVANINDAPAGSVSLSGSAVENQTLTLDASSISDNDGLGSFSYQWLRNGVAISGATGTSYVLVDADVGASISAKVSYTDGNASLENVISAGTAAVTNVNDLPTGSVTIDGTVTEDQTLSANTSALADEDGLGAFSYQWLRDGLNIAGANSSTYTLGDADVDGVISVTVSYTDGMTTAESVTSASTAAVVNVNDVPTGRVIITGTVTEDQTLNADTTTLADNDGLGVLSYQWQRDGVAISGATSGSYTLGDADVGAAITVVVAYTDGNGTSESITSASTAAVANINDAPSGGVSIDGSAVEQQTLTANTSALGDDDGLGTLNYQWQSNGVNIAGATASTYVLDDIDVGKNIRVVVSYTDDNGTVETVSSAATAAIPNVNDLPTGTVTLTGTVREDQTLTANTSAIADEDGLGAFSYQWQLDGVNIAGATGSSYTLGDAEVGKAIRVVVSYTDPFGANESVTSAAATVQNVNDPVVGAVTLTGTATEDRTLSANTSGLSDIDGLGSFNYQWQRNGVAISGATGSSYTLGDDDVGKSMRVVVSYTDGKGTVETVTSAGSAAVVNVDDALTGSVGIDGFVLVGFTVSANTSGLSDDDGLASLSYQWLRDGVAISGATSSDYVIAEGDAGRDIQVQVTYNDIHGGSDMRSSANATVPGEVFVIVPDPSAGSETPVTEITPDTTPEPEAAAEEDQTEPAVDEPTATEVAVEEAVFIDPNSSTGVTDAANQAESGAVDDGELTGFNSDFAANSGASISNPNSAISVNLLNKNSALATAVEASINNSASTAFASFVDPLVLVKSQNYSDGLDHMRESVMSKVERNQSVLGGTVTVTAGLSVGYVVWLVRSGVLLSGALSALPAWRFIDPLPVLSQGKGRMGIEDSESLESIVETGQQPAEDAIKSENNQQESSH